MKVNWNKRRVYRYMLVRGVMLIHLKPCNMDNTKSTNKFGGQSSTPDNQVQNTIRHST